MPRYDRKGEVYVPQGLAQYAKLCDGTGVVRLLTLLAAWLLTVVTGGIAGAQISVAHEDVAEIELIVRLADGSPAKGASVYVSSQERSGWMIKPRHYTTDTRGRARWKGRLPRSMAGFRFTWTEEVSVRAEGHLPKAVSIETFSGASVREEVSLRPSRTTAIRLRDETGVPLKHRNFKITYSLGSGRHTRQETSDTNGGFRFEHPALRGGFRVYTDAWRRDFDDTPVANIVLTPEEVATLSPVPEIKGRLVNENGQAASGWFLARGSVATGAGGASSGPTIFWHRAEELLPIGGDGAFSVLPAGDQLILVSPEGVPHLFPLSPESWKEDVRRLTIRVPPVRRVHHGRLSYEDGSPAARVGLAAYSFKSGDRHWQLNLRSSQELLEFPLWQALAADGSGIGELVTDGDGRFRFPIYYGARVGHRVLSPFYPKWPASGSVLTHSNVVLTGRVQAKSDYERNWIRIEDHRGYAVTNASIGMHFYQGKDYKSSSIYHGAALFIPKNAKEFDRCVWTVSGRCLDRVGRHFPGRTNHQKSVQTLRYAFLKPIDCFPFGAVCWIRMIDR